MPILTCTGAADSDFDAPLLSITARPGPDGQNRTASRRSARTCSTRTACWARRASRAAQQTERAFPSWATIPGQQSLATARNWHLFFAWVFVINGIAYVAFTVFSGHLRRDLLPRKPELRGIGGSLKDHLLFRHRYGRGRETLQRAAEPGLPRRDLRPAPADRAGRPWHVAAHDALFGGWVDILGGRQSARTLHFAAAFLLLAFVACTCSR
jgi:thiosulfate reductase cytochrome b subunit